MVRADGLRRKATAVDSIGNSVAVEEIIGIDCYVYAILDAGRVAFFRDFPTYNLKKAPRQKVQKQQ